MLRNVPKMCSLAFGGESNRTINLEKNLIGRQECLTPKNISANDLIYKMSYFVWKKNKHFFFLVIYFKILRNGKKK